MFKYNNILFGLALSLAIAFDNASPTLGKTISSTAKARSTTEVREITLSKRFAPTPEPKYWGSADSNSHQNQASIQAIANSQSELAEAGEANLKLVRRISLGCFLLLFIPLGIFYPLFLFYRRLLGHDYDLSDSEKDKFEFLDSANFIKDNTPSSSSIPGGYLFREQESELSVLPLRGVQSNDRHHNSDSTANSSSKKKPQSVKTFDVLDPASTITVSKLQIAFSPQAGRLRSKLSQVASSSDRNRQLIELLRQTISVLLGQQYWTHVSYSSDSLSEEKVPLEFDLVSHLERNKCLTKKSNLSDRQGRTASFYGSDGDCYNYVVVTLILCTAHDSPLFDKIYTEAQLVENLVKLSQIENDRLLKFELLWNPQPEAEYISNEQLLTHYSDLTRLL